MIVFGGREGVGGEDSIEFENMLRIAMEIVIKLRVANEIKAQDDRSIQQLKVGISSQLLCVSDVLGGQI